MATETPVRPHRGMVRLSGGSFAMGSEDFFPEERPVRDVRVDSFWIDQHPVTNTAFARFVRQTGYLTVAERTPAAEDYPGAEPQDLVPGALVFRPTERPVPLDDWRRWWRYVPGACWRHPRGPGSTLDGLDRHPVTQVAYEDAAAYATWAGKQLPTEAEWEYAARGGLAGATYVWGDEFEPTGRRMANIWVGAFPWQFHPGRGQARRPGTTAVGTYAPNGYGLHDMTGNVWEWTVDHFHPEHPPACCAPQMSASETTAPQRFSRHVVKGGSFLCAADYCLRYRPAARQGQTEDTATCHLGFRCVMHDAPET